MICGFYVAFTIRRKTTDNQWELERRILRSKVVALQVRD